MTATVIRTRDVVRVYRTGGGELRALDGVSLSIGRGELVAIMGPSGSGKSTFMNVVGCLDRPTSGTYELDGIDVTRMDRDGRAEIRNSKIGFVFQAFNLLARTSAIDNVQLPLLYGSRRGLTDSEIRRRASAALSRVGLAGRESATPSQLSGGEQQRVAIARSLVNDPAVILADEPTGNLDTRRSEEVMALFQALNDEGRTIVVITHEADVASFTRRLVQFRDGHVVSDAPVEQKRLAAAGAAR